MANAVHHILLVEDSEDDAELLQAELRKLGRSLAFRRVETAEEMERALAEENFEVVISDHRMPRFDAIRAFNLLRKTCPHVPFVIMSGTMPEESAVTAMRLGANDFIDKSNPTRLIPVIERELRNARLIRAKEHVEKSLIELTYHDTLTALPNGKALLKRIEESIVDPASRSGRSALVLLDLDRFMRINESFGYAAGDELLKEVADRLLRQFSQTATVARVAQDKFALFFVQVGEDAGIDRVAHAVRDAFDTSYVVAGEEMFITATIGVSVYPDDADSAATLVHHAESAMFEAKKSGPRMVLRYRGAPTPGGGQALRLESALRHAVERNELFLAYQPCIDTATERINGVEALVRWRHPSLGIVAPDQFIALADETGLIVDIGYWVLNEACRQLQEWLRVGLHGLSMSVNVSAAQFRQADFAADVARVLAATRVPPSALILEITETVLMHDAEATIATLRTLKDMGVRLSVDDFGTGYSSLSYLKRFPIDILKIDRSFLQGLAENSDNQAIVRTIIGLAKSLKLSVVAEGVETPDQFAFLRTHDCDLAQGFLFSKPVSPSEIGRLVQRQAPVEALATEPLQSA